MDWTILRYARSWSSLKERPRFYTAVLTDHLEKHRQMALVSGPRQAGKPTPSRPLSDKTSPDRPNPDPRNPTTAPAPSRTWGKPGPSPSLPRIPSQIEP